MLKRIIKWIIIRSLAIIKGVKIDLFNNNISISVLLKTKIKLKNVTLSNATIINNVKLNDGLKITDSAYCNGNIIFGKFVSVNGPGTRIVAKINKITIGSFTSIASNCVIQEFNHKFNRLTSYYINKNIFNNTIEDDIESKGDIVIGEDVWIGTGTTILSGVNIGRGSIIGANSVVTKDIPPYSIAVGNPAHIIKKRFSDELIDIIEKIRWWEWDIKKIRDNQDLFNMSSDELLERYNEINIID